MAMDDWPTQRFVRWRRRLVGVSLSIVLSGSDAFTIPVRGQSPTTAPQSGTHVVEPISPTDLTRFGEFLSLAAPQTLFLTEAHTRYLLQVRSIFEKQQPAIDAASEHAQMVDGINRRSFAAAAATAQVYREEAALKERVVAADRVLFSDLESVLGESQLPEMLRVLAFRQRAYCVGRTRWLIRSSRIDLSAMVNTVVPDLQTRGSVDAILRDYELQVTPKMVALEQSIEDIRVPMLELSAWRVREENDEPIKPEARRQRSIDAAQRQEALLAESVRLQRDITALNERALAQLLATLPEQAALALRREYRRLAYPMVHPDGQCAIVECSRLLEVRTLDQAQRDALGVLCGEYESTWQKLSEQMEREYAAWCEKFARTLGMPGLGEYQQTMRDLREKRWRATAVVLEQIESIAPAQALADAGIDIRERRRILEIAMREGASDKYPGP